MNVSTPPPLPPPINTPTHIPTLKCYEKGKRLRYEEAMEQVEHAMRSETERRGGAQIFAFVVPLLEPLLQCGPVCGIIALVEAAAILGITLDPDVVLQEAIRCKMTKSGEMFSATGMQNLVNIVCQDFLVQLLDTTDLFNTYKTLTKHLALGNPCLIPYDAGPDHRPALRNGHAAHWAVLHGVVVPLTICNNSIVDPNRSSVNYDLSKLFEESEELNMTSNTYLIAHHGKSQRMALWEFNNLMHSNQNLKQVSPKISDNSQAHVFDCIQTNLSSKLILIKKA